MSMMLVSMLFLGITIFAVSAVDANTTHKLCRSQPGESSFPTTQQLAHFNSSIDGRLVHVVPSAEFCKQRTGGCTDAEWSDSVFRSNIPGAMLQVNWEQDYTSQPPSLCFRDTSVCGQGSVPIYALNATAAAHIQTGVRFAQKHNLKVAVKASGHDFLGRSTAIGSLLLWTRYLDNITFHDSFKVGGKDEGSAVAVGSGVGLHTLYQATKARGKIFVGGKAGNVAAAGGYIQGAGHSALSPLYGLAADNALEFEVVIANGDIVIANEGSYADLFWALRGGGSGSWGVVISATFRTFPTFNVTAHNATISLSSSSQAAQLATLHAQHIFDWDDLHASQYATLEGTLPNFTWTSISFFPNSSVAVANDSIAPFMEAVAAQGFNITDVSIDTFSINDVLSPTSSDPGGFDIVLGSRLVPGDVYRYNATSIGEAYQKLLDAGEISIIACLVAGGRVSENSHINSAVNPKWRTAKTHIILTSFWNDDTPPNIVESIREDLTQNKVPILSELAGKDSGSYSNEGDVREPAFQTTFFGTSYARLSAIKEIYDPTDLFIVGAGVGSERWDTDGLCRIE